MKQEITQTSHPHTLRSLGLVFTLIGSIELIFSHYLFEANKFRKYTLFMIKFSQLNTIQGYLYLKCTINFLFAGADCWICHEIVCTC